MIISHSKWNCSIFILYYNHIYGRLCGMNLRRCYKNMGSVALAFWPLDCQLTAWSDFMEVQFN